MKRGDRVLIVTTAVAVLVALLAWLDLGPFGRLWPIPRGLSSVAQYRQHTWRQGSTLILALSVQCAECMESVGFYRDLAKAAPGNFDMLVAFDDDLDQGRRRLRALDITVQQVMLVAREDLGVDVVPALLLVDSEGLVKQRWTGQLDDLQRREVASALGITLASRESVAQPLPVPSSGPFAETHSVPKPPAAPGEEPSLFKLRLAFASPAEAIIVDVRPREEFRQLHIDGSINIPRDELVIRFLHEVDLAKSLFLFCDQCAACKDGSESVARHDFCRRSAEALHGLGAREFVVIDSTLGQLKKAGIPLVSGSVR